MYALFKVVSSDDKSYPLKTSVTAFEIAVLLIKFFLFIFGFTALSQSYFLSYLTLVKYKTGGPSWLNFNLHLQFCLIWRFKIDEGRRCSSYNRVFIDNNCCKNNYSLSQFSLTRQNENSICNCR